MKNLETLIQELCPDGVEFVKLGDVCEIKGRIGFRGYTRKDLVSESEGAITLSPSNIINGNIVYDKCSYISWAKYEESPEIMAEVGDVVFTKTASVGKTAYIENMPKEMTINPQLVLLKKFRGISKYLAYILKTTYFQNEVKKFTGVGSVPNVPQSSLAKIEIPLPPIEVQTEIVRILDKFTSLEAELEAELDCRKRQYEYYRDKLLSFDKVGGQEVEWKTLGELAEIGTGSSNTKDGLSEGLYPFYTRGQEVLRKNEYEFDDEAIITAGDGVGVGKVIHYVKGKYALHQRAYRFKPGDLLNARFLYFYMTSTFYKYVCGNSVSSSVSSLRKPRLLKYPIPLLPMQEQIRIVSILDRFESLTTSLQSGLPAEITARRQQYEHYRDKLLTFKRKGAA